METQEIWKDIEGYEGLCQVSSLGNCRKLEQLLKLSYDGNGYRNVKLPNKKSNIAVHRLVAQAFLGLDIDNRKIVVCHKNDIKTDNRVENLFIGTQKDNIHDMIRKGRRVQANGTKRVSQIDTEGNTLKTFNSILEAGTELGVHPSNISRCAHGLLSKSKGYKWSFIN